jgi:hypothetical protein
MGRVTRFLQAKKRSEGKDATGSEKYQEDAKVDSNLAQVIDAWPQLPKHIKAAIIALVHVGK